MPSQLLKQNNVKAFFNFFSPPEVPEEDEDIDEDAAEELQNLMEQDYDVGSTIRDKVIPHAVSWFTGEAAMDEYGDIDDDEDEDIDEEDEEDEDEEEEEEEEDDDDEDEDETKNRKKKSGSAQTRNDQQGERPPECKQQ